MDELCRLMNRHHLICSDENNRHLVAAYHETRDLLQKEFTQGIHEYQSLTLKAYICAYRKRYIEYLYKIKFKGALAYLEEFINDFCEKCECLNNNYPLSAHEFRYLILSAHFIDGEILTAIGALSLET